MTIVSVRPVAPTEPSPDERLFHLAFSTEEIAPAERRAAIDTAILGMLHTEALTDPTQLVIDSWLLDPLTVVHFRSSPRESTRRAERVAQDRLDMVTVHLNLSGRARGDADGRAFTLEAGGLVVLDWSRPFVIRDEEPREDLSVVLPRSTFAQLTQRPYALHGTIVDPAAAGPLAGFLRGLLPMLPEALSRDMRVLARVIVDLLAIALGGTPLGPQAARSWPHEEAADLFERAGRWIDNNLTHAPMSPEDVATGLNVSRTQLYRAFDAAGGVANNILKRRLGRVHHALLNPNETRRIAVLAYAAGFRSSTHFTRVFRESYGMTPSELRRRVVSR